MENTSHFLFICPKFNVIRRELLHTASNYFELSEAALLFGDDTLSDESNEVIFRTIHKYIQQTKRFSSNFGFLDFNLETVYYSNQQVHLLMFHVTDPDCYHYH